LNKPPITLKMKKLFFFFLGCCFLEANAQTTTRDSFYNGNVTVFKDERIDILGQKMYEYNESLSYKTRLGQGYRLMLISSSDRTKVMEIRTQLIQLYPEHKLYTIFQSPNLKLKFGNFTDKTDAEKMRKQILATGIISGNIYVVPEMVEIKPEKQKESEEE
jgi:hypothetical protein